MNMLANLKSIYTQLYKFLIQYMHVIKPKINPFKTWTSIYSLLPKALKFVYH